ncbi:unnamed protein product [Coregonus sp. 'balchen']|nr:unnamed protein product [Coregonus sp. 'balchen']
MESSSVRSLEQVTTEYRITGLVFYCVIFTIGIVVKDQGPFGDIFCRPKHSKELKNIPKALVACVGGWIMTLGSTVLLLFPDHDPDRASNFTTCVKMRDIIHLRTDNPVHFVRLVFFFLLPICIMIGCYVVIVDNLIHGWTSKLKPKVKQKSIRIISHSSSRGWCVSYLPKFVWWFCCWKEGMDQSTAHGEPLRCS